jgi:hypothetical protein
MMAGKNIIEEILNDFKGRDGEPNGDSEIYILKSMWLMMLSEFEASIKNIAENYIDLIKRNDINDIHICLLIRNFHGNKEEELTLNKITSFYKKNVSDITYKNFTQDRVPKYKSDAVSKLFNYLGVFLDEDETLQLSDLDSAASTRDSIAHGDLNIQITRKELLGNLTSLDLILISLKDKLDNA